MFGTFNTVLFFLCCSMASGRTDHDDPGLDVTHDDHCLQHSLFCWLLSSTQRAELCARIMDHEFLSRYQHDPFSSFSSVLGKRNYSCAACLIFFRADYDNCRQISIVVALGHQQAQISLTHFPSSVTSSNISLKCLFIINHDWAQWAFLYM